MTFGASVLGAASLVGWTGSLTPFHQFGAAHALAVMKEKTIAWSNIPEIMRFMDSFL
jgi:hypothetical protein